MSGLASLTGLAGLNVTGRAGVASLVNLWCTQFAWPNYRIVHLNISHCDNDMKQNISDNSISKKTFSCQA